MLRPDQQIIQLNYGATTGLLDDMQTPRGGFVYSYNPTTAQLDNVSTPEGETLTYRYDGDLPIGESWTGATSGAVDFQLNNDLVPDSITVNNSDPVSYDYDNDLLLKTAGDLVITRGHAAGLITRTTLGAIATGQDYNDFGELERLSANSLSFNNVYTRDKLGRIDTRTETLDGTTTLTDYDYDLAGRLEAVTVDGVETERYTYDGNSNRLTARVDGVLSSASVDAQDRLETYGNTGFDYTLNGELKSKTTGGVATTFDYDVFGNLLKATLPGDVTIDYVVDAQHRRIGKKVNGTLTQGFLYQDQLNPIAELDGDNNVVSRFVYGTRANVPDYLIKDGKNYRIVADHLGSPRLVVDVASGDVVQRMNFDTFGNVINDTNPGFQPFGFAGGIYDHHTELTRFGARDYDASVGRWTAKDPIGFAGGDSNLYGYVAVDPVNFVDPSGRNLIKIYNKGAELNNRYPSSWATNNLADATRHSEWQRYSASPNGGGSPIEAAVSAAYHEYANYDSNTSIERAMDFHNNQVGRNAGINGVPVDPYDLVTVRECDDGSQQLRSYTSDPWLPIL